jgi:hypothetical protein
MYRYPNVFIVGFPKCGTTSLAYWLSDHPDIYLPPEKELHYFSKEMNIFNLTEEDYLEKYKNRKERILLDASTSYIYSDTAIQNIEKKIGNAKYIVMLRNPIDLVYSLYEQCVYEGIEKSKSFKEAWELSDIRWQGKDPYGYKYPKALAYKQIGMIGTHLEKLFNLVEKDRILVLFLEELKNPEKVWKKVLSFLEIEYFPKKEFPQLNPAKTVKFKPINYFLFKIFELKIKLGIKRNLGIASFVRKFITEYRQRPPLDYSFKKELQKFYLPEIEKVEQLLNINLEKWKR